MRFFKRVISQFLPAVVMLLSVAGCSDDDTPISGGPDNGGGSTTSGSKSYYLAVNVTLPSPLGSTNSRAGSTWDSEDSDNASDGDYVYGTDHENGIGTSGHFIFFFKNGKLQMVYPLSLPNKEGMDPDSDEGKKIEVRYWTLIRDIEREDLPDKALVVLNGQAVYGELTTRYAVGVATEEDVMDAVWRDSQDPTRIGRNEDGLFVMTNTSYVKDGAAYCAVPVTEKMFHELKDVYDPIPPQIKLPEDEILIVRVERMVSKVTLEYNPTYRAQAKAGSITNPDEVYLCTGWSNILNEEGREIVSEDYAPELKIVKWEAQVDGWGVNALERSSQMFKKIDQNGYNFFTNWNDQAYFRSYWAEDPEYGTTDYPWQYRNAVNKILTHYSTKYQSKDNNDNILLNYNYSDIHFNNQSKDVIYAPENTYPLTAELNKSLDGRRELLAGTHLIVRATLKLEQQEGNYQTIKTLYRDRTGVFYTTARDCLWGLVRAFNYGLSSQTKMEYRYYDWSTSTNDTKILCGVPSVTYEDNSTTPDHYKLYYNGNELTYNYIMTTLTEEQCAALLEPAEIKDGDSKRLVNTANFSIRKSNGTILPIYETYNVGVDDDWNFYENEQLERTSTETANDVQSLFFEWAGAVDYFVDGMMYYAYPTVIIKDEVYGTVRNSWYKYTVTGINNIGIPVHDASMPIVPNWENPFDQINVKVNILDWHEINGTINGMWDQWSD